MEKKGIISNPWCYLRVSLTHQKRQNIGDSSGNRLFLDWFITEDTMKKRPDSFFNFLFGQERIGRLFTWQLKKALEKTFQRNYFQRQT